MKRFIIKIISFFVIVLTVDTLLGYVFGYLQSHSKGGETYRREYIANTMTDSILIMGSSRARHHYDPRILIDSLGFSSFNCGLSGNGIICNYGQYSMLSERYAPKIIIYDVFLNLDLNTFYPNEHYIDGLRPYYDRYGIDSIFFAVDVTEKYKMLSQMRKYNGYFTTLLLNYLKPRIDHTRGFRPLYGKLDYGNKPQETEKKIQDVDSLPYDPLKLMYIKRLIKETRQKGTRLIFCISPIYGGGGGG